MMSNFTLMTRIFINTILFLIKKKREIFSLLEYTQTNWDPKESPLFHTFEVQQEVIVTNIDGLELSTMRNLGIPLLIKT